MLLFRRSRDRRRRIVGPKAGDEALSQESSRLSSIHLL
jgi:hypothetical protein